MTTSALLAQSSSELSGLAGWVADVVAALGAPGVGMLVLLETVFPPIPSEVVLPLAGYLGSQDRLSVAGALIGSTVGALFGALILYWAGAALGQRRTDALVRKLPLVEYEDVQRARGWFDRHGGPAVFFGRMVPGVRSFISLPAGIESMPLVRFCLYTTCGSLIWNAGLISLGWALGNQWQSIGRYSDYINWAIWAAIGGSIAWFVWNRRDRLRSRSRPS